MTGTKTNGAHGPTVSILTGGSSSIWILARPADVAVLNLGAGDVFVVLQVGNRPAVVTFDPGTYDVAGSDFAEGSFPVVIICMNKTESDNFANLPIEVVNEFLFKIRIALASGATTFGGFERWYVLDGKNTKFRIAGFPLTQPMLVKDETHD
jgi:hypothetical protein